MTTYLHWLWWSIMAKTKPVAEALCIQIEPKWKWFKMQCKNNLCSFIRPKLLTSHSQVSFLTCEFLRKTFFTILFWMRHTILHFLLVLSRMSVFRTSLNIPTQSTILIPEVRHNHLNTVPFGSSRLIPKLTSLFESAYPHCPTHTHITTTYSRWLRSYTVRGASPQPRHFQTSRHSLTCKSHVS
jgi:hypothetical protein